MSKVVFTNGTFDVLHVGHFNLLLYCKNLMGEGGRLVVGIDSDNKVHKDKGGCRPIFSEAERTCTLTSFLEAQSIKCEVHIFDTNVELYEMIKLSKPDIIVKGSDWQGNVVGSDLAEVKLYPRMEEFSSSKIINRIVQKALKENFLQEIK